MEGKKANKNKKRKAAEPVVPSLASIKRSKEVQRKLDSLIKKKERDEKRSLYLQKLKDCQLSSEHQSLMLSTRSIGQTMSGREQLKHLLKKQKAGIVLSKEEENVLYPYKASSSSSSPLPLLAPLELPCHGTSEDSHTTLPAADPEASSLAKISKSTALSTSGENLAGKSIPPSSSSSSTSSFGSKMLQQLQSIKANHALESSSINTATSAAAVTPSLEEEQPPRYVPTPLVIPLDVHGVVQNATNPKDDNEKATSSTYKHVNRMTDVQVLLFYCNVLNTSFSSFFYLIRLRGCSCRSVAWSRKSSRRSTIMMLSFSVERRALGSQPKCPSSSTRRGIASMVSLG